jgi:hypothetical protein
MTTVNIVNTQSNPSIIPIREAKIGVWYIVEEYEPNPRIKGELGVIIWKTVGNLTHQGLVTPHGSVLDHHDLKLRKLDNVTVTVG